MRNRIIYINEIDKEIICQCNKGKSIYDNINEICSAIEDLNEIIINIYKKTGMEIEH
jgi:hypothetical protein